MVVLFLSPANSDTIGKSSDELYFVSIFVVGFRFSDEFRLYNFSILPNNACYVDLYKPSSE